MENVLTEAISEISDVTHLANPQSAAQHLPADTQFATVATVMPLDNPDQLKLHFGVGMKFGDLTTSKQLGMDGTKQIGYLYHNGTALTFATDTQVLYSWPATSITSINNSYGDFFLFLFSDGKGLLVGQVVPINFPAGSTIRSTPRLTDNTSGWYSELARLGVISQQQAQAHMKSATVATIIIVIAIFLGMLFIAVLH